MNNNNFNQRPGMGPGLASSLPNTNTMQAPANPMNSERAPSEVVDTTVLTAVSDPNTSVPLGPSSFSAKKLDTGKNWMIVPIIVTVILVSIIGIVIALMILS